MGFTCSGGRREPGEGDEDGRAARYAECGGGYRPGTPAGFVAHRRPPSGIPGTSRDGKRLRLSGGLLVVRAPSTIALATLMARGRGDERRPTAKARRGVMTKLAGSIPARPTFSDIAQAGRDDAVGGRISARPLTRSSSIRTRVLRAASAGVGRSWTNPGWSTGRNNRGRPRTKRQDRWKIHA